MKRPEITNPKERGKVSSTTVKDVFLARSWVVDVRETVPNEAEDGAGYDMFVHTQKSFFKKFRLGGASGELPVQIKSSEGHVDDFVRNYAKHNRFFNIYEDNHQFVLCGMDKSDIILADIVGQIMVHVSAFGMKEKTVLKFLDSLGDKEAVLAYKEHKVDLLYYWYGDSLPPM